MTKFKHSIKTPDQAIELADPGSLGFDTKRLHTVFEPIEQALVKKEIGAAVGLVAKEGKIVHLRSLGKMGAAQEMAPDAIVRIASITKTITAAAVMILVEDGKLVLDDPVAKFLPEYDHIKVAEHDDNGNTTLVKPKSTLTVHHLLTHQGGITSDGEAFWHAWNVAGTVGEFSRMLAGIPLEFHPGEKFHYGHMGSSYELLAAIVEKVSQQSFRDFIRNHILNPLQMNDTYFEVPKMKRNRLSAIYMVDEHGELGVQNAYGEEATEQTFWSGGGGLRTTILDYFVFAQCLLNGGQYNNVRILSKETVKLMTTNRLNEGSWDDENGWGYGAWIQKQRSDHSLINPGSYGWNGGTGTVYLVDPKERMVIILFIPTRPGTPNIWELRTQFIEDVYKAL